MLVNVTHARTTVRAYTRTHLAGDTFDRSREGKIEVNMTLSFAGLQHDLNQKLAHLKSRIVELVQGQSHPPLPPSHTLSPSPLPPLHPSLSLSLSRSPVCRQTEQENV